MYGLFNPLAPSNRRLPLPQCFRSHEREKRRAYEQRVREVELGSFTLLVFAATGGMGKAATVTYGRIASLIATKRAQPYCQVIGWLRCLLGFSLLRLAIMCIRSTQDQFHVRPVNSEIEVAVCKGRISQLSTQYHSLTYSAVIYYDFLLTFYYVIIMLLTTQIKKIK